MDEDLNRRLAELARIAVRLEAETGVPARLLISQWAVESKWGSKPVGHFNCFGIKLAARHTKSCSVMTREVVAGQERHLRLEFADYDSLEDSCKDYAWLITHGAPYREAWALYQLEENVHNLVCGIAHVYATDLQYGQLVTRIAEQSNVAQAICEARTEATA